MPCQPMNRYQGRVAVGASGSKNPVRKCLSAQQPHHGRSLELRDVKRMGEGIQAQLQMAAYEASAAGFPAVGSAASA